MGFYVVTKLNNLMKAGSILKNSLKLNQQDKWDVPYNIDPLQQIELHTNLSKQGLEQQVLLLNTEHYR